ncbi:MAG: flagellin N-terminal helical domain-containing protein [Asticcacaulis sp.]|uniref:flagellin N-terminal helical domain-containing protein n=1 Tax=Asticcacaulis sp. TaxID=1872648 RepID=UPI003F7C7B7E
MASILTNNSALLAAQSLNASNKSLLETQKQVSTGLKVSSAKDNGATYAIAQHLRAERDSWSAVQGSLSRGKSILDVAASAIGNIQDVLLKLQKDAVSLNDTSLDSQSRTTIQNEMQTLIGQMDQSVNASSFDGENLLNRSGSAVAGEVSSLQQSGPTLSLHLDQGFAALGAWAPFGSNVTSAWHVADAGGAITSISTPAMYPSGNGDQHVDWNVTPPLPAGTVYFTFNPATGYFGVGALGAGAPPVSVLSDPSGNSISLGSWDLRSQAIGLSALDWTNPKSVLTAINSAQQSVMDAAQAIGSKQNLIDQSIKDATSQQDQLTSGIGNLVDADMATQSAKLQAQQVQQALATQSLSIANSQPKWILDLFK